MRFRNLSLFRFAAAVAPDADTLHAGMETHRLRECGPLDMSTRGFVAPFGDDEGPLMRTFRIDGHPDIALFAVGSEDKILPAATINKALKRKIRQISERDGRPVGGRERKRLKAEVLDELLPRALCRPSRVAGYLDLRGGWVVLDTASRKAAETTLVALREAIGSFPAVPAFGRNEPRRVMTTWLANDPTQRGDAAPDSPGPQPTDECELVDPSGLDRWRGQKIVSLGSNEVYTHLRAGKQVARLGVEFEDRMGFVLGEDLIIRKLRLFDIVLDTLDGERHDSIEAEREASFLLTVGEIRRLLPQLCTWFDIPRPGAA